MFSNTQSFLPHWCNSVTILGTKYTYGKFLCRVCELQMFFSVQSVSNAPCRPTCCLGCAEDTVRVPASVLQWAVLVTPPNTLDPTVASRLNTMFLQLLLCGALTTTTEPTCLGEEDLNWNDSYHKITSELSVTMLWDLTSLGLIEMYRRFRVTSFSVFRLRLYYIIYYIIKNCRVFRSEEREGKFFRNVINFYNITAVAPQTTVFFIVMYKTFKCRIV